MSFAFKKFNFVQHTEVPTHAWPKNSTCCAASPRHVYVGCDNGSVHVLDGNFQTVTSFQAHAFRVFHVMYLESRRLLVSLGSEEPGYSTTTLKLWDLPNILHTRAAAGVALAGFTPPQQPAKLIKAPDPAAGSGGVLAVAVGLATGMVYLLLVDLPHTGPAAGVKPGAVPKQAGGPVTASKPISTTKLAARPEAGHAWAVTGLELHGTHMDDMTLFAVTESQTLSFNLKTNTKSVLDAQGAPSPGCTVLRSPPAVKPAGPAAAGEAAPDVDSSHSRSSQTMLLVARDEGLYNYTSDTRAGCTVLEGSKQRLVLLGRHVVVVTQEKSEVGTSTATVLVIDLSHKLIAGSLTLPGVTAVLSWAVQPSSSSVSGAGQVAAAAGGAGGGTAHKALLVVVTSNNKLYTLKEVALSMQLESLFKRSLHKLALDLARVQQADAATLANIQQRWGDALYVKGEFDAAMTQYCQTIGHLEASYVIRRFLDAQRIHNLTSYLELLHEKGVAGADHTTLLLNCYTKLKDVDKLDAFIQRSVGGAHESRDGAVAARGEPGGDADRPGGDAAAVDAGRGAKADQEAHEEAGGAGGTSAAAGEAGAGDQGEARPQEAAGLKFDAETAVKVLRAAGYPSHALTVAQAAGNTDWQLAILLEDCQAWDEALALMVKLPRAACAAALRRVGKVLVTSRPEPTTGLIMDMCAPSNAAGGDTYAGSVADFAHLFCDAPTALMLLCEFILNTAPPGTIANERMLYHTLLELYLADKLEDMRPTTSTSSPGAQPDAAAGQAGAQGESAAAEAERKERRAKALALLQSGWPPHLEQPKYDQEHALVLCRLSGFKEGLVLLYDRLRLYREVMQVHMSAGEHAALIAAAVRYGDVSRGGDPQLWAILLEYLASQPGQHLEQQVVEVVEHIEARGVMPPVMVLQFLSANKELQVRCLRGYVSRHLARESAEAARDREAAGRLAADSASLKAELSRLKSQARVFQASRCSATGQPLELPAVHFMCGHAYNARALGDNDKECPLCSPDFRRVVDIRRNMAASALQQDRFFTELRESADGFSVVAEHFGRGLINMTAAALSVDPGAGGSTGGAGGYGNLSSLASLLTPST